MFESFLEQSGIPLLMAGVCFYFSWRLIKMHDLESVRGKDKPKVRHHDEYAEAMGRIILIFGIAVALNAVLVMFNVTIAFVEIIAAVVFLCVSFKKVHSVYE